MNNDYSVSGRALGSLVIVMSLFNYFFPILFTAVGIFAGVYLLRDDLKERKKEREGVPN